MVRESNRKRAMRKQERRFGRPERLADLILSCPMKKWRYAPWITRGDDLMAFQKVVGAARRYQSEVSQSVVIEASNIAKYFFESPKDEWSLRTDFPGLMPPFPLFFVECVCPDRILCEGESRVGRRFLPEQWGWLFKFEEYGTDDYLALSPEGALVTEKVPGLSKVFWASMIGRMGDCPAFPGITIVCGVSKSGSLLTDNPMVFIAGPTLGDQEQRDIVVGNMSMFCATLLAVSFMNCKNVLVDAVEPSQTINRERQRHGLKPFLRYHTINIEPMKTVLRTEGGIEHNGLKKALHICRGHFATYSEDRPLFGRHAGTFWVPSHVRGSAKQGVVVSDYSVKAPGLPPEVPPK